MYHEKFLQSQLLLSSPTMPRLLMCFSFISAVTKWGKLLLHFLSKVDSKWESWKEKKNLQHCQVSVLICRLPSREWVLINGWLIAKLMLVFLYVYIYVGNCTSFIFWANSPLSKLSIQNDIEHLSRKLWLDQKVLIQHVQLQVLIAHVISITEDRLPSKPWVN